MKTPSLYHELYDLCIKHMTHQQATYVAITLSVMPTEKALALVDRAMEKVSNMSI